MKYVVHTGDAISQLRLLPDDCIDTCVTSPPYYGLRDYNSDGQIGVESCVEEYIRRLVEVFREVRRVMADNGTMWVVIGDSYCSKKSGDCKPKDLIGIPWTLAFALRADGWYLRQDIIWAKNNPMPESVKDRCTRSHEYIFMFTKSRKYYFDHGAIQEDAVCKDVSNPKFGGNKYGDSDDPRYQYYSGNVYVPNGKRNKRDVWNASVSVVKDAHFATFPKDLILPCILAGCPEGGVVLDPFSGSGTTGIVALNNNRNYVGIEINPEYVEMSIRRIQREVPIDSRRIENGEIS